jgi:transposase-like protein
MDEIVELYKKGMGTTKIANHLELNYRVRISKFALDRFVSTNYIIREI